MSDEISLAAEAILRGKLIIYPTETLYALGAGITRLQAVEQINNCKQRDQKKPLPVIIGSLSQLQMITDWQDAGLTRLIQSFWPGPLTILVPGRSGLSPRIQDQHGFIAVRWTSHPTAQDLALRCRSPLVATSANPGGEPPAGRPEQLDPALLQQVTMVLRQPPYPAGGAPSTVVRILKDDQLQIFREGAVRASQLQKAGWTIGKIF